MLIMALILILPPAGSFNGLFLDTANDLAVTVSQDTTLGFITNAANNANFFNITPWCR